MKNERIDKFLNLYFFQPHEFIISKLKNKQIYHANTLLTK